MLSAATHLCFHLIFAVFSCFSALFQVNRLILLAPFTSTKAMASKVAASAMGGGSFLSRAVSGLVSKQIAFDNKEQLERFLTNVKGK